MLFLIPLKAIRSDPIYTGNGYKAKYFYRKSHQIDLSVHSGEVMAEIIEFPDKKGEKQIERDSVDKAVVELHKVIRETAKAIRKFREKWGE